MEYTFGIEEEFMLVDLNTMVPVGVAEDAIQDLAATVTGGCVTAEFLPSQIEHATLVCRTVSEAHSRVLEFRESLQDWAAQHGVLAMPSGTPFDVMRTLPELPSERHQKIARDIGHLTSEHLVNGMHVHIGISDPDEGIRLINGLRGWLPAILALSANSPFWARQDTHHHSWRSTQTRRWTTYGIPPWFTDRGAYEQLCRRLTGLGATQTYCSPSWSVRMSEHQPTIEVRVCDTQLTPDAAVAMAAIVVTLGHAYADADEVQHNEDYAVLDAELWHAARYGISNGLFNPVHRVHADASDTIRQLRATIAPHAAIYGADDIIDQFLASIVEGSTQADRQRRAYAEQCERGLIRLYQESLSMPSR